jgi:hypothetical protein
MPSLPQHQIHTLFDTLTGRLPDTPEDSMRRLRHRFESR